MPFAIFGTLLPFADDPWGTELLLAACVLLLNGLAVAWQTQGQVDDLQTPPNRTDSPRIALVSVYTVWALYLCGAASGFSLPSIVMFSEFPFAVFFAERVSREHFREPTAKWAFWHRRGVLTFHEDLHQAIAVADACWLILALRFLRP